MATAVFIDKNNKTVKISERKKTIVVKNISNATTSISEILPFRVRFNNIGITSYGSNDPAPIGIAIIGLNNYIL
jgi:hypothetical protein